MPLLKGNSDAIVSENVREMRNAGHPEAQAVAASLRAAGRGKKKGSMQSPNKMMKPKKAMPPFKKAGLPTDLLGMTGDE